MWLGREPQWPESLPDVTTTPGADRGEAVKKIDAVKYNADTTEARLALVEMHASGKVNRQNYMTMPEEEFQAFHSTVAKALGVKPTDIVQINYEEPVGIGANNVAVSLYSDNSHWHVIDLTKGTIRKEEKRAMPMH
jgi:hypothetical protein